MDSIIAFALFVAAAACLGVAALIVHFSLDELGRALRPADPREVVVAAALAVAGLVFAFLSGAAL